MKKAGLTQEALAKRLSRLQSFVSKYERGESLYLFEGGVRLACLKAADVDDDGKVRLTYPFTFSTTLSRWPASSPA